MTSVSESAAMPLSRLRDAVLAGAECVYDPYLHTGPDVSEREPKDEREAREAVAKDVCRGCAVRPLCLAYALRTRPAAGVWAAMTADEIAAVADALAAAQETEEAA
jgi:WhiB family redox-sensing transcriptional regulator